MRHSVFGKRLGRNTNSRKALLMNLVDSLFKNGQIITTLAKAKFVRPYAERLITISKKDKLSRNRFLSTRLTSDVFKRLISEIGPGFNERSGGYTRIVKLGLRRGDAAKMARLELLEWRKPPEKKDKVKTKDKKIKTKVTKSKSSRQKSKNK